MLTNPLDPSGVPTSEEAERLAHLQGLTGKVVSIEESKLRGKWLVNYKSGDDIRAAVADLRHEVWKLTDEAGQGLVHYQALRQFGRSHLGGRNHPHARTAATVTAGRGPGGCVDALYLRCGESAPQR